jgi:serine/threonine protein kinase
MPRLQESKPEFSEASRQDTPSGLPVVQPDTSQSSDGVWSSDSGLPSTDHPNDASERPPVSSTEAGNQTESYFHSATFVETPARQPEREFPSIAGYEILGVLGRGGMGRVYKSRHLNLNRLVALKVILDDADADPERVARFREEAKAIARLQHPNIVQIYEVGEHNGHPFLCLELVEGGSLREHMRGTPLSAPRAARLVETLARAVHAAHQQGVIHRDLKPANILLAPPDFMTAHPGAMDGWVPKITDFGLAKKSDESVGLTLSGAVMGTPKYMAPEQAAGRSRDIGPASDTYALGVILYELLTGRTPFHGSTMEVLDQVRHAAPLPPRRIEPEIPASLETICLKCLEKEPAKRYSSAAALAADLRRFLENKPILARPIGPFGHVVLWARRNRWPLVAAVAMAAAVPATWFVASFWQSHVREERDRERLAKEREWKEYQETRSQEMFEKLLTDGPSSWPLPPEERLVFQNGLHDLQVRKNRANIQGDQAETKTVEALLKRAEPLLRRLQSVVTQADLAGLQLPGVESARTAAKRAQSTNNLKQLGLAIHNFNSAKGYFPQQAIYSRDSKPLLSWRVTILPYLQQTPLYSRFKLDEPWDSPHNRALLKYMPPVYMPAEEKPTSDPYTTFYQGFVGTNSPVGPVFEPDPAFRLRYGGCTDGTSQTLLFVEAGVAVPWTKPEDILFDPGKPLPKLGGVFTDGIVASFMDGSARFLARDLEEETIRALITRNGGELIEWTKLKGN